MKEKKHLVRLKAKINYAVIYLAALILSAPQVAFATQPGFVTSTIKLCDDATTWIIAADVSIAVLVCVFFGVRWKVVAPDKKPAQIEAIKGTIGIAVVVVIISAVVKLVLSYYK